LKWDYRQILNRLNSMYLAVGSRSCKGNFGNINTTLVNNDPI